MFREKSSDVLIVNDGDILYYTKYTKYIPYEKTSFFFSLRVVNTQSFYGTYVDVPKNFNLRNVFDHQHFSVRVEDNSYYLHTFLNGVKEEYLMSERVFDKFNFDNFYNKPSMSIIDNQIKIMLTEKRVFLMRNQLQLANKKLDEQKEKIEDLKNEVHILRKSLSKLDKLDKLVDILSDLKVQSDGGDILNLKDL
jgi:hypothetical protein